MALGMEFKIDVEDMILLEVIGKVYCAVYIQVPVKFTICWAFKIHNTHRYLSILIKFYINKVILVIYCPILQVKKPRCREMNYFQIVRIRK